MHVRMQAYTDVSVKNLKRHERVEVKNCEQYWHEHVYIFEQMRTTVSDCEYQHFSVQVHDVVIGLVFGFFPSNQCANVFMDDFLCLVACMCESLHPFMCVRTCVCTNVVAKYPRMYSGTLHSLTCKYERALICTSACSIELSRPEQNCKSQATETH